MSMLASGVLMRAFRVDQAGNVDALDELADSWCSDEIMWDVVELDEAHDLYVNDEALFAPAPAVTATIAGRANVPLPAYILGRDGERDADATLTLAQVRGWVSNVTRQA